LPFHGALQRADLMEQATMNKPDQTEQTEQRKLDLFNPETGAFAVNIRDISGDDSELRWSLKEFGWIPEFPALADENDVVLVGHRRLKIATEEKIEPVIKKLTLGKGDVADAERLKLALVSNIGSKPMTKADRKRFAEHLYGAIAAALNVSQRTVSEDLRNLEGASKLNHAKTETNPKGAGRPKGSGGTKRTGTGMSRDTTSKVSSTTNCSSAPSPRPADGLRTICSSSADRYRWKLINASADEAPEASAEAAVEEPPAHAPAKPNPADDSAKDREIAALKAKIARLETRIQELEQAPAPGEAPSAARVVELEAELTRQRKEREEFGARYWEIRTHLELRTEGIFSRREFNKVRAMLHPDRARDAEEQKRLAEAFDLFSRCEKLLKKEPLPKPPSMPTTTEEWMEGRLHVLKRNQERGRKGAATRARKKPGRQLENDVPAGSDGAPAAAGEGGTATKH
jgi:hypothetical protein